MACLSQVLIQQGEDGHGNHRYGDDELQGFERHREQQECTQARTNGRENDRGQQTATAENAPP